MMLRKTNLKFCKKNCSKSSEKILNLKSRTVNVIVSIAAN